MSFAAYRLVFAPAIFVVCGLVLFLLGLTGPLILAIGGAVVAVAGAVTLLYTWRRYSKTGSIGPDMPSLRTSVFLGVGWLIAAAAVAFTGERLLPILLAVIGLASLGIAYVRRRP